MSTILTIVLVIVGVLVLLGIIYFALAFFKPDLIESFREKIFGYNFIINYFY